jgi:protein phosphatase
LLLYPAGFRRVYRTEMLQTFRAACRETWQEEGRTGLLRLASRFLTDLAISVCKEQVQVFLLRFQIIIGRRTASAFPSLVWAAPFRLQVSKQSDIGNVRSVNEDSLVAVLPEDPGLFQQKGALFVVADGMGGYAYGERASELAVTLVREKYYQDESAEVAASLVRAIELANARIYAENMLARPDGDGDAKIEMGTTCIAAVLQEKALTVANVGDSRAYVIHGGQMRQISRDHSLVADMVRAGEITAEEARLHEKRNIIYRALGISSTIEVDTFTETIAENDILLLCTDGLSGLLSEEEMLRIIETYDSEESVRQLIAQANAAGGTDNITAIVVHLAA